jgi:uncharacterized damage-inducible protein DinB
MPTIAELLLPEFDQENANTRKTLERVPADKWDWKPHAKSGSLGWLAAHLATLPNFTITMAQTTEYEIDGGHRVNVKSHAEMLPTFDNLVKEARQALAGMTDAQFNETWTLKWKGNVIFSMPKYACIRSAGFNHVFHHRGQLTVYLRLLDIPVPALYGPSADEQ